MMYRISRWNLAPTIALAVLLGHIVVTAQAGNAPVPAFEVAAIKINRSGEPRPRHSVVPASGQVTITNITVRELIQDTYGVPWPSLLINLPEWARTQRVDVIANAASPAPVATLQRMLQPLLAEHFKLAAHWEPREMEVFALVVANPGRLGLRLQRNDACCELV